jgi:hypothetical protein
LSNRETVPAITKGVAKMNRRAVTGLLLVLLC